METRIVAKDETAIIERVQDFARYAETAKPENLLCATVEKHRELVDKIPWFVENRLLYVAFDGTEVCAFLTCTDEGEITWMVLDPKRFDEGHLALHQAMSQDFTNPGGMIQNDIVAGRLAENPLVQNSAETVRTKMVVEKIDGDNITDLRINRN